MLLAIDGNSLVHRSYHAQARTGIRTTDGRPTWAVRGLLTQLVAAVERVRPAAVVVGFDDPDSSERRSRWPTYKAHRSDKLETLVDQLAAAADAMRSLGVAVVVPAGLEADDVLASAAAWSRDHGCSTVVATSDRDAFSLIDDTTRVLRIIDGGVDASPVINAERLVTLLGVRPEQYRDYAALRGDPSDNLPGVRGIGPRRAAGLLTEFGTVAAAFADLDGVRSRLGATLADLLADASAQAKWRLNCEVMAMRADVPLDLDLTGGAGVLPLAADRVGAVFAEQNLIWSTAEALRVLADDDSQLPRPVPVRAERAWPDTWPGSRPRHPKLPERRPAMAQLTLF